MSAADFQKLLALPTAAALASQIEALQANSHAPATVAASPTGWLSIVGQALTFALIAASEAAVGVVTLGAQTFAGVKTFASGVIASAGITTTQVIMNTGGAIFPETGGTATALYYGAGLNLRSSRSGAAEVAVRMGPGDADGAVNAANKLTSVGTGLSGIYVEKRYVRKDGTAVMPTLGIAFGEYDGATGGFIYRPATGEGGISNANGAAGIFFNFGSGASRATGRFTGGTLVSEQYLHLNTSGAARPTADANARGMVWYSRSAGGAADTLQVCLKSAGDTYAWVTLVTG